MRLAAADGSKTQASTGQEAEIMSVWYSSRVWTEQNGAYSFSMY